MKQENNENYLNLSDYLIFACDFNEDPTDEHYKQIQDWLAQVEVREYMPLKEKEIAMVAILNSLYKDFDAPGCAGFLETGKITWGLLSYCTNVVNDVGSLNNTFLTYDLYFQHGLVDCILNKCEADYNRLCHMVDNAVQFSNIYRLIQSTEFFNDEEYDKWLAAMADIKDTINSENLQEILKFMSSNDESGQKLLNTIQQQTLDSIKKEDEGEQDKYKELLSRIGKKSEA